MNREICRKFIHIRSCNPAWMLLASRRAPLVLGCLIPLFEGSVGEIAWEDAIQRLAKMFAEHANTDEFELSDHDFAQVARRELRDWLRCGLVVERNGILLATDSLQKAFNFVNGLDEDSMTSTASRLSTVQREIENLEAKLNPERTGRIKHLKKHIATLQRELDQVEHGNFEVLSGARAREGIREVYQLAISLRSDFRRVEDSYREADRLLRQEIIRSNQNRGYVLDRMLDGHDELLRTPEGQVFDVFYEQLSLAVELDQMMAQLRAILANPAASEALSGKQIADLSRLVPSLVRESQRVIEARARGESDVRRFIKAGLGNEHHRVGTLLNDIQEAATMVDWSQASLRRSAAPLPPMAISIPSLPVIQRLRFKDGLTPKPGEIDLTESEAPVDALSEDFWKAFDCLDRQKLFEDTIEILKRVGKNLSVGELASILPPSHDLESLAYWLSMAREAEVIFGGEREVVDLPSDTEENTRFNIPLVFMNADTAAQVIPEALG